MAKAVDTNLLPGFDFADAMHVTLSSEAEEFITFDRKLVRLANKAGVTPPVHSA